MFPWVGATPHPLPVTAATATAAPVLRTLALTLAPALAFAAAAGQHIADSDGAADIGEADFDGLAAVAGAVGQLDLVGTLGQQMAGGPRGAVGMRVVAPDLHFDNLAPARRRQGLLELGQAAAVNVELLDMVPAWDGPDINRAAKLAFQFFNIFALRADQMGADIRVGADDKRFMRRGRGKLSQFALDF